MGCVFSASRIVGVLATVGLAIGMADIGSRSAMAGEVQIAAKRLGPTNGRLGTSKRLMDPSTPAPRGGTGGKVFRRGAFKWFWSEVSPSRTAASSGRWPEVLQIVEQAREKGKPVYGSQALARRILKKYGPFLKREAKRRNVSLPLLIAVIAVESNGNSGARSPVGAGGLMQLMPGTARRFGVSDAYAPAQNIRGGAHYLDWLLRYFKGDAVLALAGYNAGEGAVDRHRGVPPYAETRDYVAKVAGAYLAARTLCSEPPLNARGDCSIK